MDAYLLDTNIASCLWDKPHRNHERAREFLRSLRGDSTVLISVVTLAEIEYGLRTAPNIDAERQAEVRRAMSAYSMVQGITRHTVEFYAELRAQLFKGYAPRYTKGKRAGARVEDLVDRTTSRELGIQENDLWIAAQALEWNAQLVTDDRMVRITGVPFASVLRVLKWLSPQLPLV